jgi:ribosomal protein S18 acetylase RimI-like enzyme
MRAIDLKSSYCAASGNKAWSLEAYGRQYCESRVMVVGNSDVLQIVDDALIVEIALLEAEVDAFNARVTGIDDARLLSILLKRNSGELYAGLHGHTWGGTCQIKLLWVAERDRECGLGTQLLRAAEDEARRRGCRQIMLSTHSFQAPDFYRKHGFMPIATLTGNPVGHEDILMVKQLVD